MYITQDELKELLDYDIETGIFTWKVSVKGTKGKGKPAGTTTAKGYVDVCIKSKKYGLHRLAFLYMTGMVPDNVDHKNGNKADNSWANLRPATVRENAFNYKGWGTKSGYKNVYFDKRGNKQWWSRIIGKNGERIDLGYFHTPEEANEAAVAARKLHHGEFYHDCS